jgi:hypothetical protein
VGTSENAVKIQIWTYLIAIVLLKALQQMAKYKWHLSKFDQCAAFAFVCKNRTESIHQQTLQKKQPLGARKYPIESVYLDKRGVKIEKYIFATLETSKINKIYYP